MESFCNNNNFVNDDEQLEHNYLFGTTDHSHEEVNAYSQHLIETLDKVMMTAFDIPDQKRKIYKIYLESMIDFMMNVAVTKSQIKQKSPRSCNKGKEVSLMNLENIIKDFNRDYMVDGQMQLWLEEDFDQLTREAIDLLQEVPSQILVQDLRRSGNMAPKYKPLRDFIRDMMCFQEKKFKERKNQSSEPHYVQTMRFMRDVDYEKAQIKEQIFGKQPQNSNLTAQSFKVYKGVNLDEDLDQIDKCKEKIYHPFVIEIWFYCFLFIMISQDSSQQDLSDENSNMRMSGAGVQRGSNAVASGNDYQMNDESDEISSFY
eukprot:403361192